MSRIKASLPQKRAKYRLGIDIGGTFTDYSLLDESTGKIIAFKSPTIPKDPAEGVARGLRTLISELEIDPGGIEHFVHGSTIAVNTLIQRTGANLSLFVTEGFRDIFRIQRLRMPNPFDFNGERPLPLVRRQLVFEIKGRMRSDGSVFIPLDEESVKLAVRKSVEAGVDGIAVCLINAYKNGEHERQIKRLVAEIAPQLFVCCSTDIWPEMREYERAVVTTITGYIRPKMAGYLGALESSIKEIGVTAAPYITKSNGGIMTARTARAETAQSLLSGPASGVTGAAYVAGLSGFENLITLDIGGTSADIALVQKGQAEYSTTEHVAQLPVIMPVIGVSSIGAGGGSIAWIDPAGVLKVGPQSGGADPGPACYGLGGTEPTLTDAFLVCGLVNPENFLGGRMKLDRSLAEKALAELAKKLKIGALETAQAVIDVAVANMYAEFNNALSRQGVDPRRSTLVAFGGAGPLLANALAQEFNIANVLVPLSPGTLCALGAMIADVKNDYVRSVNLRFDQVKPNELKAAFDEMKAGAKEWLKREGPIVESVQLRSSADMRYVGQAYEIEIEIDERQLKAGKLDKVLDAFHKRHEELYAHSDPTALVEIINLRLKVIGATPKPVLKKLAKAKPNAAPKAGGRRKIYLGDHPAEAAVYQRKELLQGHRIEGPAIVEQTDTTVYIPDGYRGTVDRFGSIVVRQNTSKSVAKRSASKQGTATQVDKVTLEILRNYGQAAVEGMAHVLERTAYTTFIKESLDFATALATPEGEFFAYPRGMGVSSYIGLDLGPTLRLIPHYEEGDIILTNDPYTTKGLVSHLPDLHLFKPIFHKGKIFAFAWMFLHSSDIGGFAPASVYMGARDLYQEGLRITPLKLYTAGVVNQTLVDMIKGNCRIPEGNWGDLQAAVACLNTGERYVHDMIEKFGADIVRQGTHALLDYSEERTRVILAEIPDGTYTFHDYLDSDVVTDIPVRVEVTIRKKGSNIELDYTGCEAQLDAPFNIPSGGMPTPLLAPALINYAVSTDLHMPLNRGLMRPIRMKLPQGTVVNPEYPGACGVRYATVHRIFDACLGALSQALPDGLLAAGAGQGCPVVVSLMNSKTGKRDVTVIEPLHGGGGGRVGKDGIDANEASSGFLRNTPVESVEAHVPVIVNRYDLIPDSAGAGKFRGGFGNRLDFQVFQPNVDVTARSAERHRFQPWGVHGGKPGAAGKQILNPGSPGEQNLGKIVVMGMEPGNVLSMRAPGGGGYGDPLERDLQRVLDDVLDELVSREAAQKLYGVVIVDNRVDEEATERLRATLRASRTLGDFDFGPERAKYESVWSDEVYHATLEVLMNLPVSLRGFARRRLHQEIQASAEKGYSIGAEDVKRIGESMETWSKGANNPAGVSRTER